MWRQRSAIGSGQAGRSWVSGWVLDKRWIDQEPHYRATGKGISPPRLALSDGHDDEMAHSGGSSGAVPAPYLLFSYNAGIANPPNLDGQTLTKHMAAIANARDMTGFPSHTVVGSPAAGPVPRMLWLVVPGPWNGRDAGVGATDGWHHTLL
ncbi:hypothetical protein VTK73DRAFT_1715 [Phialemonium thermophilum]|uniref:Uncharacterized protein n=1 Tax=Phialemonium thermophilum TaxID=223376 RepID=A0ABR3VT19_9PEZI